MAKWGEGDPRWIVEERPDSTNVNNWHWCAPPPCGRETARAAATLTRFRLVRRLPRPPSARPRVGRQDGEELLPVG